jgi:hypothetical protein
MKIALALFVLATLVLTGCKSQVDPSPVPLAPPTGESPAASPSVAPPVESSTHGTASKVIGTWKVDLSRTTIPLTEKEKVAEAATRVDFKSDGTYSTSGGSKVVKGKWKLNGDELSVIDDKAPSVDSPVFKVSTDGSMLIATQDQNGKIVRLVMVKA